MEWSLERLFFPAVVLLLMLGDMLIRWAKRKVQEDRPKADVEAETVFVEDEELPPELPEPAPAELLPPVQRPPQPLPLRAAELPPPAPRGRRRRPQRGHRWLKDPLDARRGIVLMTILGPCPGMQGPDRITHLPAERSPDQ
jgi:hypothetical protein